MSIPLTRVLWKFSQVHVDPEMCDVGIFEVKESVLQLKALVKTLTEKVTDLTTIVLMQKSSCRTLATQTDFINNGVVHVQSPLFLLRNGTLDDYLMTPDDFLWNNGDCQ